MSPFKLTSKFKPSGDQPKAIKALTEGIQKGYAHQTLLGVTGSGKTYTAANVIANIGKPTLVIAHNKTLAAQLTNEFRELFPENSVNYFVSYYDYYQPEAYIPSSDTYIGKEAMINEEIDKLRHRATSALLTRPDVIVVSSVSCIYGLGAPETYREYIIVLEKGKPFERASFVKKLVSLQFTRTNSDLERSTFRVRGDQWEIMPPEGEVLYRFDASGGKVNSLYAVDPVSGFNPGKTPEIERAVIAPAKHFITEAPARDRAIKQIKEELKERLKYFESQGKYLEAERIERRTKADLAMMREIGYCNGIENYSQPLSGRPRGAAPDTLLDYFPKTESGEPDFLTIIDESHVTVSQIGGMYEGDQSRKRTLIEYGFRLPSAADNRPLRFDEFNDRVGQIIYTSATPGKYEIGKSDPSTSLDSELDSRSSGQVVEQIIRPTGLVDPKITIRPVVGQIDDVIERIDERINPQAGEKKERVLVTTLTKRMAEDLSSYLEEKGVKVTYLHSDVKTMDRIRILSDFRRGTFDVLVGVNLLREGLDLPEVSLVCILDGDKEGFLRSETSLIQTIGRAARNERGEVVIYADVITGSIERAVSETARRREIQIAYNKKHGITPKTIIREIKDILVVEKILKIEDAPIKDFEDIGKIIKEKEAEMRKAAKNLDFEVATILRDEIMLLEKERAKQEKDVKTEVKKKK